MSTTAASPMERKRGHVERDLPGDVADGVTATIAVGLGVWQFARAGRIDDDQENTGEVAHGWIAVIEGWQ